MTGSIKGRLAAAALLLAATATPAAATGRCGAHPWCDLNLTPETPAELLLAELTPDERVSLLAGDDVFGVAGQAHSHTGTGNGVARLGLPTIYYSDGPMGSRQGMATAMPAPIGLAATWDPTVANRYGAVVANEVKNKGNDVVFAPTVNIMRTALGGRTFEGYGEDPWLVSRIAVAWIEGAQSEGVIANVKHFAANNQEGIGLLVQGAPLGAAILGDRFTVNAVVDERTLREIYLPAFEAAVKEANVGSVMCSYNRLNGEYACESRYLLTTVLRDDWGFRGYVLSDYGAAHPNGTAASLKNGLDFEPWPGMCYAPVEVNLATTAGLATSADVDGHVRRILRTLFAYGAFDRDPYQDDDSHIDKPAHALAAAEVEESAITLLKNDGALLPLPLDASRLRSIAIIGADAKKFQARSGSAGITPFSFTTPGDEITQRATAAGIAVVYDPGSDTKAAAVTAAGAEVALVFVSDISGEGADKPCLALDCGFIPPRFPSQDDLIAAVAAANPKTVVVLETGGPVLTSWRDQVGSIVETWIPGVGAGPAIANVLFGDVDPGGRLPVTFPPRECDTPTAGHLERYPGVAENVYYTEGVHVGYRWYDANGIDPAFPFGHGLSYTSFAYGGLSIVPVGDGAEVSFDVTNDGSRAGSDVAQVYVGPPEPLAVPQPPRSLKGFSKVTLLPGETRRLTVPLDRRAFSYWDSSAGDWRIGPGCYPIKVGRSSRDVKLTGSVALGGGQCGP